MSIATAMQDTVADLSREQAKILAHYAAGESADEIAMRTRLDRNLVINTIQTVAKGNRNLAQNMAMTWQSLNPEARTTPSPAPAAAPTPIRPVRPDGSDTVRATLRRAIQSGQPKMRRLADRIDDLIGELETLLGEHERTAELREEARKLEQRLAEIKSQLSRKRPSPESAGDAAPATSQVRAWAHDAGVECPARGRIPARVMEAYQAAVTG